ncbi:Aste57867_15525 [Aphanomyces stellatus]|uniref:Aste57867_15525 protein n=1 Tax=Aphanomyces stellatus TaxID=120398 RepID=A0A485L3C1_9STRA|nr:hypothetical protein As57867_015469 [Aphanomyces stellatus]VFT92327.1 Aste57867_15525 [Aphanomyces stellatus]
MAAIPPSFDLAAYLARIGLPPLEIESLSPADSLAFLHRVVTHHRTAIPFENLAVCGTFPIDPAHVGHAADRISVDVGHIFQKLVVDRRGGYCFEQNTLLAVALRACGYDVNTLMSRVAIPVPGASLDEAPRIQLTGLSHLILLVRLRGSLSTTPLYLCDVGFGGRGQPPCPLLLDETPIVAAQGGEVYQLRHVTIQRTVTSTSPLGEFYVVDKADKADDNPIMWGVYYQTQKDGEFHPGYVFSTAHSVVQAEVSSANWNTSTNPSSFFTQIPVVVKRTDAGLFTLHDTTFKHIEHGQVVESRIIDSHDKLIAVLRDTFGLHAPKLDQ